MLFSKRTLAGLLAALLLAPALPKSAAAAPNGAASVQRISVSGVTLTEPGWASPGSLFPLEERELARVDLLGRFPDELERTPIALLLGGESAALGEGAEVAWRILDSGQDYSRARLGEEIDLSRLWSDDSREARIEIISRADPTDPDAVRYMVPVRTSNPRNFLTITARSRSSGRELVDFFSYHVSAGPRHSFYGGNTNDAGWEPGDGAVLKMDLAGSFQDRTGLDIQVYRGDYAAGEDIPADEAVTEMIWGASGTGYEVASFAGGHPRFTLVVRRDGRKEPVLVMSFGVELSIAIYVDYLSLSETSGGESAVAYRRGSEELVLRQGLDASTPCYLQMTSRNFADPWPIQKPWAAVDAAYAGEFASREEAERDGAEDIRESLFDGGWLADYSQGVSFTIFDIVGRRHLFRFRSCAYVPETGQDPGGDGAPLDGCFHVTGAAGCDAYVVPAGHDSGYADGYQTILLLNHTEDPDGKAVTDSSIRPTFDAGADAVVYGDCQQTGPEQTSGVSQRSFTSGEPLCYSTGSTLGDPLRSYWVTFVTQYIGGPKLFINGVTNAGQGGVPAREIDLSGRDYYDLLVANIGDRELTGLEAELSGAQNVRLDDYWNLGAVGRLAAFTTTEPRTPTGAEAAWGELFNVTKIRLVRDGEGEASGTLTIRADQTAPVTIRFPAGPAGPEITTQTLTAGVKHVPYSFRIQAKGLEDWEGLRFTPASPLPNGLELRPDGEIYGVPQVQGSFAVSVLLSGGGAEPDQRSCTLEILDSTDDNVHGACDPGYGVLSWVGDAVYDLQTADTSPRYVLEAGALPGEVFRSEGQYACFERLWLDGRELKQSQYTARQGSTCIVVTDPELDGNTAAGRHTLAAEFREEDGTLRRTAQNYYIVTPDPPDEPDPPITPDPPDEPDPPITPDPPDEPDPPITPDPPDEPDPPITPDPPDIPDVPVTPDPPPAVPVPPGKPDTPRPPGAPEQPKEPEETPAPGAPAPDLPFFFTDVAERDWFYEDVRWAYSQGLMLGLSEEMFAPEEAISQSTIVTVLARLLEVDLSRYADASSPTVLPGMWYTEAAIWAQRAGLLPDNTTFTGTQAMTREEMAIMLRNYLLCMGIDPDGGGELHFEDEALMSSAGLRAFQVLYSCGIFRGVGGMRMDPRGTTTRAQFAALVRRVADFAWRYSSGT